MRGFPVTRALVAYLPLVHCVILLLGGRAKSALALAPLDIVAPKISPATGLPNQFYKWKHFQIRYQCTDVPGGEPVILVHGLFVNSDHWRKTLAFLGQAGYAAYALDLLGCGYSDKPPSQSAEAQAVNGETRRFKTEESKLLRNAVLGTPNGKSRRRDVELTHPAHSPYNFYTWSDLITDFCRDVVLAQDSVHSQATLICNSIGTISAFQAMLDTPELFRGVFAVSPNFRELHSSEVVAPHVTVPILRRVQQWLRQHGQPLFDSFANPRAVKAILRTPYVVDSAIDNVLVQVLLDPLLTPGASNVVFDILSYSAGPLPEPQLAAMPRNKPVWICYGKDDPWTPGARVEALAKYDSVERVVGWKGVGHCPHDEAPEKVNPLLLEFLQRVTITSAGTSPPDGVASKGSASNR